MCPDPCAAFAGSSRRRPRPPTRTALRSSVLPSSAETTALPRRPAARAVPPAACDVLVVGGGINGCGITRDLAGRGASVVLCEKDDLASHTSSASTKLIHGGLRYLEHYEFGLVKKALAEREGLLCSAPHIMWPLRFVMPHDSAMRPAWMIRAGLFLYDHLARRKVLPGSRRIDLRRHKVGQPLKARFTKGFVYSDGWVDDARLVALCAVDAAERGATVLTRTRCTRAERGAAVWTVTLESEAGGVHRITARALVNATGPWAAEFLRTQAGLPQTHTLRLIKGSHIVVAKLFDHRHAYIFQNADRRIIFAIPYEGDFTLVGTTDVEHRGAIGEAAIDTAEIDYLCEQVSRYFAKPVLPKDVVWSYSGVRPLLEDESSDASAVTRDYRLELDAPAGAAPLLSVWGGKITTFRKLGEEAADTLMAGPLADAAGAPAADAARRGAWTGGAFLPGGDLSAWIGPPLRPDTDFTRFEQALRVRHAELPPALLHRYARCYGSRIDLLLGGADDLGVEVAPGVFEAELVYLRDHEWATRVDDVLWRRTKLGLHLTESDRARVAAWWAVNGGATAHVPGAVGEPASARTAPATDSAVATTAATPCS